MPPSPVGDLRYRSGRDAVRADVSRAVAMAAGGALAFAPIEYALTLWAYSGPIGGAAKLKLAAFQFQKYGMLDGRVVHVNPDASEDAGSFRALIALEHQHLLADGRRYPLQPGMQVAGEIHLGTRSVLEYLLSPVQKAFHEAARER